MIWRELGGGATTLARFIGAVHCSRCGLLLMYAIITPRHRSALMILLLSASEHLHRIIEHVF